MNNPLWRAGTSANSKLLPSPKVKTWHRSPKVPWDPMATWPFLKKKTSFGPRESKRSKALKSFFCFVIFFCCFLFFFLGFWKVTPSKEDVRVQAEGVLFCKVQYIPSHDCF